jgi:ParB/RepB/Spo0J family partition protein
MDNNDIANNQDRYTEVSINDIEIDKNISIRANNPNYGDSDEFKEIKGSISENGILAPITVTKKNEKTGKYTLVDGFYVLKAVEEVDKDITIPVIITDSLPSLAYFSLNYFRINLTAIEKAQAICKAAMEIRSSKNHKMSDKEVANGIGISAQKYSEYLKVATQLAEAVKIKYLHKNCNIHSLRKIVDSKDEKEQERLIEEHLQEKGISVGQAKGVPEEAYTLESDEKYVAENQEGTNSPINNRINAKNEIQRKKESSGEIERKDKKRPWEVIENHIARALNTAKKIRSRSNLSHKIIVDTEFVLQKMISDLQNECNEYGKLKQEYEDKLEESYIAAMNKDSGQSTGKDATDKENQIPANQQNYGTKVIPPPPHLFPSSPA